VLSIRFAFNNEYTSLALSLDGDALSRRAVNQSLSVCSQHGIFLSRRRRTF